MFIVSTVISALCGSYFHTRQNGHTSYHPMKFQNWNQSPKGYVIYLYPCSKFCMTKKNIKIYNHKLDLVACAIALKDIFWYQV